MNKHATIAAVVLAALALSSCDSLPDWLGGSPEEKERLPGDRMAVLPANTELQPDPALGSMPVNLPPSQINAEWAQHPAVFSSASSNLTVVGSFEQSDSAEVGDGAKFRQALVARPVAGGGSIFAMDGEGRISAHDLASIGNRLWVSEGVSEEDDPDVNGGGLAYEQGRLYAVSGRGVVAAMDAATGKVLWKKSGFLPFRSAPKVAGGKLFAITISSELIAFDAATGEALWSHRGIDETTGLMNAVSPAIAGNVMVVPYSSGELYALSVIDGQELWNNSLAMGSRTAASAIFSGIGGDPVIDGDVVFAASSGGSLAVYGIPHGQPLWTRPVASLNTPWVAGDWIFVLTSDNVLSALVKYDGRVRWSTQLPRYENEEKRLHPIFWRGPVLVDGKLAVANAKGEMLLISAADGSVAAQVDIPDDVLTTPVVAGGRMYVVTQSAKLYSLY